MAGLGIRQHDIAGVMELSINTLRKYYLPIMTRAKTEKTSQVAANLFRMATGDGKGAIAAAIFWLKTQGRWTETAPDAETIASQDGKIHVHIHRDKKPDRKGNGSEPGTTD